MKKTKLLALVIFALYQYNRAHQQKKNPIFKGFFYESKQFSDYQNLSIPRKLIFWVMLPVSYFDYLKLVLWDRIDRWV